MGSSFGGARSIFVFGVKVFSVLALCSRGEVGSVMVLVSDQAVASAKIVIDEEARVIAEEAERFNKGMGRSMGQARGALRWQMFELSTS